MTSTLKLFPHKRQKNGDIINSLISKRTKVLCNLNVLPVEVLSRVIMFLDLSDLPRALPLSKIWYTAYKDVEQDLWLTLVRKHHPFLESLTTELFRGNGPQIKCEKDLPDDANKKQILPSPSFDWKKQFRRRQIYLRNDAPSFRRAVPVPPPCSLSHYIFQVDLKCHLQPVRGMPKQTKILTVIASASEGLVEWDVDRLNINLESAQVDLSRLPLFSFDVSVYVIQRETAKQALLYKGSPEDWMDFGCCMYDSFSSPQTLFSDFGTYVALEATSVVNVGVDIWKVGQIIFSIERFALVYIVAVANVANAMHQVNPLNEHHGLALIITGLRYILIQIWKIFKICRRKSFLYTWSVVCTMHSQL
eukprot:CAMPEP_0116038334 /NCGR_PEP_ID=MMETSP0321-20121206/22726_1 /TAXON_ID=163516 /ORGANISM="Leptocylindrus danicus var. danicus, Strain B650" /LENGTH=361 /DNA_ID=CAMNT_0003516987 /DNA_START=20 /DNA_END=1103 /DNA_ORIENTATION=-